MANHQTNASRNSEIIDDALRTMLQYTPDIMFVKDVNLIYAAASQSFAELAGKASADDVIGKTDFELFDNPQLAQKYVDNDRSLFASGAPLTEYIEPLPEKDGLPRYSSTSKYIIRDRDGNAAGLLGIGRDITCEYQAKENYRHELNYFFQLPEDICAAVLFDITGWRVTDARSRESYDAILPPGGTIEDYLKNVRESIVDDEHASSFFHAFSKDSLITLYESGRRSLSVEYLRRMPGNEQHWIREDAHFRTDPVNGHIVLMMILHDIDSIKREEKELIYAAEQDVLTGLLNRSATMKRITRFLKEEGASGTHALFMVDVDNFKSINDTFGHQMGDYVLADIAATLRHCFRESDISGRIGGDEFFILMKNVQSPDAVEKKAKELTEALQYVCSTSKSSVELSGSVGISVYNGDFKKLEALYAEADAALYEAKALGKKRFCIAGTKKKAVDFVMDENETANAVHLRTILENMEIGRAHV